MGKTTVAKKTGHLEQNSPDDIHYSVRDGLYRTRRGLMAGKKWREGFGGKEKVGRFWRERKAGRFWRERKKGTVLAGKKRRDGFGRERKAKRTYLLRLSR